MGEREEEDLPASERASHLSIHPPPVAPVLLQRVVGIPLNDIYRIWETSSRFLVLWCCHWQCFACCRSLALIGGGWPPFLSLFGPFSVSPPPTSPPPRNYILPHTFSSPSEDSPLRSNTVLQDILHAFQIHGDIPDFHGASSAYGYRTTHSNAEINKKEEKKGKRREIGR